MKKTELLSPAGNLETLKVAVQNGADSVYFGSTLFNARASANNFDVPTLKKAIQYCKLRNVRTFLTLNILIKNSEFNDAINLAQKAYEFGIDALIISTSSKVVSIGFSSLDLTIFAAILRENFSSPYL